MPLRPEMRLVAEPRAVAAALWGLVAENVFLMREAIRHGGGFPRLYLSGIVYRPEPRGQEDWQDALRLLRAGEGDCEDLASYLCAERIVRDGIQAVPHVVTTGSGSLHALTRYPRLNIIEDPSKICILLEQRRYDDAQEDAPSPAGPALGGRDGHPDRRSSPRHADAARILAASRDRWRGRVGIRNGQ